MDVPDLRSLVERHFRVYEARSEKAGGQVAARMYCVMFPPAQFDERFEAFRTELKAVDPELFAFMRRDGGEDILYVARRPPAPPNDTALAVTLFILTLATTLMAGVLYWNGYANANQGDWRILLDPGTLAMGFVTFTLPLMTILGVHEFGHWVAARRHGLRSSLPRFLPFPPLGIPIGTLGAFIRMRDEMPDRKALFDIGASGPVAGFLVALPLLILGAHLTATVAEPVPDYGVPFVDVGRPHEVESGPESATLTLANASMGSFSFTIQAPPRHPDKWLYTSTVTVTYPSGNVTQANSQGELLAGERHLRTIELPADAKQVTVQVSWDDGLVSFGEPLIVKAVNLVIPSSDKVLTHPVFFAGWVGLLVTGINLLPAGQLDGGHVARALLGDRMRYLAYGAVLLLLAMTYLFNSWMLMLILLLFMGIQHPPPLNERTPLGPVRTILGILMLLLLIVTFIPQPFI